MNEPPILRTSKGSNKNIKGMIAVSALGVRWMLQCRERAPSLQALQQSIQPHLSSHLRELIFLQPTYRLFSHTAFFKNLQRPQEQGGVKAGRNLCMDEVRTTSGKRPGQVPKLSHHRKDNSQSVPWGWTMAQG